MRVRQLTQRMRTKRRENKEHMKIVEARIKTVIKPNEVNAYE